MVRVLLLVLLAVIASAPPASAHGVSDTADLQLAQSFAGNELTVVVRRTPDVPGPLHVDLIAHDPVRPVGIDVSLAAQRTRVDVERRGTHPALLSVDRAGPWELVLTADTGERATVPFRVLTPRFGAWEPVAYGGLSLAGFLLATTLVGAMTGRRGGSAVSGRRRVVVAVSGAATGLALTVAVTAALLSSAIPPATPEGALPTQRVDPADGSAPGGRPYVNLALSTDRPPVTGVEFELRLSLTDGNTGRPVDDLVAHHAALTHLVLTSADGRFFRHLHPVRAAPGGLAVRVTPERPGRHLVHAEFERADSGSQLVSGAFEASGAVLGPAGPAGVAEADVRIGDAVAGRATTLDVTTGEKADLQPWLGMAGHLVLRDEAGGFFGHVHEMTGMSGRPDETVARFGPTLRFTFTFPRPGRYLGWVQYQRDLTVSTVPVTIDVRGEGG
ncbi:hypothetical protein FHS29_004570 [Saccharothrix tamanrassetensis]|uniref:Secreted protein n=1 Tax=Saccharothrix tamanrassetensis TaxID=1051531 RepID=A0A841CHE3_9PSEU|nr:hypothetical protein [Saccharothrix tamanrassetensis]MBB5957962.1 hypothetical protein [Saccharothrix tamanrassetensis]